VSVYIAFIVFQ